MADFIDFKRQLLYVFLLHKGALDVHKMEGCSARVAQCGTWSKRLGALWIEGFAIELYGARSKWPDKDDLGFWMPKTGQSSGPTCLDDASKLGLVANEESLVITLGHHGPIGSVEDQRFVATLLPFPNAKYVGDKVGQFSAEVVLRSIAW